MERHYRLSDAEAYAVSPETTPSPWNASCSVSDFLVAPQGRSSLDLCAAADEAAVLQMGWREADLREVLGEGEGGDLVDLHEVRSSLPHAIDVLGRPGEGEGRGSPGPVGLLAVAEPVAQQDQVRRPVELGVERAQLGGTPGELADVDTGVIRELRGGAFDVEPQEAARDVDRCCTNFIPSA